MQYEIPLPVDMDQSVPVSLPIEITVAPVYACSGFARSL